MCSFFVLYYLVFTNQQRDMSLGDILTFVCWCAEIVVCPEEYHIRIPHSINTCWLYKMLKLAPFWSVPVLLCGTFHLQYVRKICGLIQEMDIMQIILRSLTLPPYSLTEKWGRFSSHLLGATALARCQAISCDASSSSARTIAE